MDMHANRSEQAKAIAAKCFIPDELIDATN